MMILSILLKSYALVLWPVSGIVSAALWGISFVLDRRWLRERVAGESTSVVGARRGSALVLSAATLVAGLASKAIFFEATLRWKSGLPFAAQLLEWLFALLQFPVGSHAGRLYTGTMVGSISFPVNLDTLGLLLPLLVSTIGLVYLLYTASSWRDVGRGLLWLAVAVGAAVLLRWVLATLLFLAVCDFVNYETEDLPIRPFFSPVFIALFYLPFLAVAATVLNRPLTSYTAWSPADRAAKWGVPFWIPAGFLVLFLVFFWEPRGTPKNGKVLINTYHTDWSRTDRPYDRDWYGAGAGYNYACLKRLYERFFDTSELTGRITAEALAEVSILIIYDPNRSFTPEEIQAVRDFVARGGGLFVIGDHTNVFGSSSHLNQILTGMGLLFRDDVLFDLDADFFQLRDIPLMHAGPLHGMTFFKFRGPASIRSTSPFTRNLFTIGNAKSLRAIYSVNNFYPPPHDHPKMWTGDFAVSMTSRHGRGRIAAFADSTVFSNFEIFYPGKYEFLLNVVNWLNHEDAPLVLPMKRLSLVGVTLLLGVGLFRAREPRRVLGLLTSFCLTALVAWCLARLVEQSRADFPEPAEPMRFLFFAAEPEDEALTLRAFVTDTPYEQKYDVFIQWVLRADIFSGFHLHGDGFDNALAEMLRQDDGVETGLALIVTRPDHLTLMDELSSGPIADADRLLLMFSSELPWEDVQPRLADILSESGLAQAQAAWPAGVAQIEEQGRRIALVFRSERFSDREMGFSEKVTPNDAQRARYDEQFALLDWLFNVPEAMVEADQTTPQNAEN